MHRGAYPQAERCFSPTQAPESPNPKSPNPNPESPSLPHYQFPTKSVKIPVRCGQLGRPPGQTLLSCSATCHLTEGGLTVVLPIRATMPSKVICEFNSCL